ncbi:testis-specific serine/threonine-protein kinase 3-like isoform X2 [Bacillus rossius redtenbacheri]|uniref:testis-specific serine/threonine-protein kinase 3-like isoform X2 n=1 Tax=Bacillus rossius redtenbacheri TaxID=93214 RepID=UPI002FDEA69D
MDNDENKFEGAVRKEDLTRAGRSKSKSPSVLEQRGYQLGEVIGTGTYSVVQRAYSNKHKQNVAIKIITKANIPVDYLEKFVTREVSVVKGLKHPNIITFLEAIETTHRVFIVMEEAQNGNLLDLIRRRKYLDEETARRLFSQILDVIEYCYSKGIVHRDIKCENLLLDEGFNIKLSDFGFARGGMFPVDGRPRKCDSFCGSFAYASPEVLTGQRHDPYLSDVWSAGVVLFAMVFGCLPFRDRDRRRMLKAVHHRVRFPREPVVSDEVKRLIEGMICRQDERLSIEQLRAHPWMNMKRS